MEPTFIKVGSDQFVNTQHILHVAFEKDYCVVYIVGDTTDTDNFFKVGAEYMQALRLYVQRCTFIP